MRRWIFSALVLTFVCASPAFLLAKDEAKAVVSDKAKQEKEALIANINGMRAQEIRVTILGQVLNEEVAKLRNLEAVFTGAYKLDVEKYRKGLYRYDDKSGKIVEQPAPAAK